MIQTSRAAATKWISSTSNPCFCHSGLQACHVEVLSGANQADSQGGASAANIGKASIKPSSIPCICRHPSPRRPSAASTVCSASVVCRWCVVAGVSEVWPRAERRPRRPRSRGLEPKPHAYARCVLSIPTWYNGLVDLFPGGSGGVVDAWSWVADLPLNVSGL